MRFDRAPFDRVLVLIFSLLAWSCAPGLQAGSGNAAVVAPNDDGANHLERAEGKPPPFTPSPAIESPNDLISAASIHLEGGKAATFDIPVDPTMSRLFLLVLFQPDDAQIEVKMIDPGGNDRPLHRIDDSHFPTMHKTTWDAPSLGVWRLTVKAQTDADFSFEARSASSLYVTASDKKGEYDVEEPVQFTALIESNGAPVHGAMLEVQVWGGPGKRVESHQTPEVTSDAGTYKGSFVSPAEGRIDYAIIARGLLSGYRFQRNSYPLSIVVSSISIKILGVLSVRPIDTNGNGVFDNLTIDLDLEVLSAGSYSLMGELTDPLGELVASDTEPVNLDVGRKSVSLQFRGYEIAGRGKDGPYRLSKVVFLGEEGSKRSTPFTDGRVLTDVLKHDQFE